ncbi:MAG: TetR/AcrR family transcriptional regulator [Actinomycetaceae bacterium]
MTEHPPPSPAPGLRERKKEETRRAIKDAALDLALTHGVDALTVDAISAAADISPRTFFNYFSYKEEALVTEATSAATDLHDLIVGRPASERPLRALREVIAHSDFFGTMNADRERFLARQRLVQGHPHLMARQLAQYATVEHAIDEALTERHGADASTDLRPALLAAVAVSVLRVAVRRWTRGDTSTLLEQIDAAFDQLERPDLNAAPGEVTR